MLVVFSPTFATDTKMTFVNNFVAPFNFASVSDGELKIFRKSVLTPSP